ncbi:hypothetical protein IEQ34_009701 [Dendrobium chrysotoxum]|uniref:Uncharacterized protein n=1 Tax=Dendrobium chrysotoxum TaxID=161865 RepID=A0AAV7H153_DENCH|nr:hypothetical protein IEQ34_009701 [Dendrobium chrysotoxum]
MRYREMNEGGVRVNPLIAPTSRFKEMSEQLSSFERRVASFGNKPREVGPDSEAVNTLKFSPMIEKAVIIKYALELNRMITLCRSQKEQFIAGVMNNIERPNNGEYEAVVAATA